MFGVSFHGAMTNLTQVEDLAKGTTIHTLAVLKPSFGEVLRVNPNWAANPSYHYPEITYPLKQNDGPVSNSSKTFPPNHSSKISFPRSTKEADMSNLEGSASKASTRDQMAKRTFSIIQMPLGDNPWDLGSYVKNLQTVLGTNFLEWLLPVKRSPCSNHEDPRSQFAFGPDVDRAIATLYFMEAADRDLEFSEYPQDMQNYLIGEKQRKRGKRRDRVESPIMMSNLGA